MKSLALDRTPAPARPASAPTPPVALLAQRHSTLGGGSIAAPPILGPGRPLEPSTRQQMETGFGRDFGAIRVHDDARAHDDARSLGALAYAAGDNIVFGEGQYRPETPAGQALIAHELAHNVQQGGVQMKADGPLPLGADSQLEAQADRAALDITSGRPVSGLSRIASPAVFRADTPPPTGPAPPPAPTINTSPQNVPQWVTATIGDDLTNANPTELIVCKDQFDMPAEKGAGPWVEEAYKKSNFVSTVYTQNKAASFKEDSKSAFYRDMWLNKFGFKTMATLAQAIVLQKGKNANVTAAYADASFGTFVGKLAGGLNASKSAIDHIIEKHMGGVSVPDNLQLFDAPRNSASGTQSWNKVVDLVNELTAPGMRGHGCAKIQIRFKKVTLPTAGPMDPTYTVEKLLRDGDVKGSDVVKAAAAGKPVMLKAGVNQAIADIKDTGETPIQTDACRVVSGSTLIRYVRGPAGAKSKTDFVDGELDNRALKKTGTAAGDKGLRFQAVIAPAAPSTPAAPAAPAAATVAAEPADPAAVAETPVASQVRTLSVPQGPKKIPFEYLYLSPGHLHTAGFDDNNNLIGKGIITAPSVKFLGPLEIEYGPEKLQLTSTLDVKKLNSSPFMAGLASYFRFTASDLKLDLYKFKPEGSVSFTMGPADKPFITGSVKAGVEGGAFVAKGEVKPGIAIPGIDDATGTVEYHSVNGWSGSLQAKSSKIPNIVLDAVLGFKEVNGQFTTHASGGLVATVKDKTFGLNAHWTKGKLAFSAPFKWVKPFSIVDWIAGDAYYSEGYLRLKGGGKFRFRTWSGSINMTYERFANGATKFTGDGNIDVETVNKKGKGSLTGHIDDYGRLTGHGTITYQITPTIKPEFNVTLKAGKLTLGASVTLGPYTLFPRFPKKNEGMRTLFKVTTPPWSIPTPVPGVRAYVKLFAGVQYQVFFGPGVVKAVKISGSFDPLEEDPAITAGVVADFECEAGATLAGNLGATFGVDVLLGAGAVEGTLTVGPYIKANVIGRATATGEYKDGNFTVGVSPTFDLNLLAGFRVDGSVQISALWGALSHTWTFPIAAAETTLASKRIAFDNLSLTFGSSANGLPGAQEKATLPDLDPFSIVKDLIDKPKDSTAPNPNYDPNARQPIERGFKV